MGNLIPMRWPDNWRDPSALSLLKGSVINCLLVERGPEFAPIVARARQEGLQVADAASLPGGVNVIEGLWPGVKQSTSGTVDQVDAGPTGLPWVDSNGWKIRLASALHPDTDVWVETAVPKDAILSADSYRIAIADAAASGGRWIVSLDESLAKDIAAHKSEALNTWEMLTRAIRFFADHQAWSSYLPAALLGIISDFSGDNEFLSNEILNLVAVSNQQYRVIPKSNASESSLNGLRAVLYTDAEPPTPDLRKRLLAFVQTGGTLITGGQWGELPGIADKSKDHPGYTFRVLGRGRVAVSKVKLDDPYLIANDTAVLVSHRYELLRLFNPGAVGCTLRVAPDRKRAVLQMVFYASARVIDGPTVRVAGRYRSAGMWTLDRPERREVKLVEEKDAVELQLPRVTAYAGLELEAGPAQDRRSV